MKLIIQSMESEIAEIKTIAVDTLTQAKKTNGRVNLHDKMLWTAMGALTILTPWMGWVTLQLLHPPLSATPEQIQSAVASGVQQALDAYDKH